MSEVCSSFGCTPTEAMRQDWTLVCAVLDYRNAQAAIELFNAGSKGIEQLGKHPELGQLLLEMHRAQGSEATMDGIVSDMRGRGE